MERTTNEKLPRRIGRYDVAGLIVARGTSIGSEVYVATDPLRADGKGVAIKRLAAGLTRDEAVVAPYFAAAQDVAKRLRHPNVVEIRAVGNEGRDVFLVMDYVQGETLARFVRQLHEGGDALDASTAAYIIGEACAGLDVAHRAGLVHGHLTPYDIFLGYDGSVKVLDIGIAGAKAAMSVGVGGGQVRDIEVQYSSPECCKGNPPDKRSDVFSLGAILWELLAGVSPFERAERADTIRAICDEPIPAPNTIRRAGLPEISEITMSALERDPEKRCSDAAKLRQLVLGYVGSDKKARAELARLMTKAFERRARDKKELLARLAAKSGTKDITGLDFDDEPNIGEPPEAFVHGADLDAKSPSGISRPTGGAVTEGPKVVLHRPQSDPSLRTSHPLTGPPPPPLSDPLPPPIPSAMEAPSVKPPRVPFFEDDTAARKLRDEPTSLIARPFAGKAEPAPPPKSRKTAAFLVVGVIVLLAFAGASAAVVRAREGPPPLAATTPTSPPPPPPMSTTSATAVTALATATAVATTETPSASASATPEQTVLTIDTIPTHATISIGGTKMGTSPLELKVPKSKSELTVEIQHAGYVTLKERVVPDVNQRLKLSLVAAKTAKPAAGNPYRKFE